MSTRGPLAWLWPQNESGKVIGWGPRGTYLQNYSAILGEHYLFANPIEPRFGAEGDGTADDTAEIQAAIDWLEAQGGGTLIVNHPHRITSSLALSSGKVNIYSPNSYQGYLVCVGAFTPIHYTVEGVRTDGAPVIQNLGILRGDSNKTSSAIRLEGTTALGDADGETSGANKGPLITGVRIDALAETPKAIIGATQADPVVITCTAHGYTTGNEVRIADVEGMTELNDREYEITVLTADTFSLNGEDGAGYGAYTGGGTAERQSSGYWKNGIEIHQMPFTHVQNCWIKGRGATTTTKIGAGVLLGNYCHGAQVYDCQIRGFLGGVWVDDTEFFAEGTARANSTAYAVGDIITVSSNTQYRFICTTAGTSAGSLPAAYATAARNDEVTDGTAVFASTGFQAEGLGVKKNKFQACDRGFYATATSAENTWSIQNNSLDCGYANVWLRNGFRVAVEGNTMGWNNRRKDHVDIYMERTDGASADEAYKIIASIKNNICFRPGNLTLTVTGITKANPAVISYTKAAGDPHPAADDILFISSVEGMTEVHNIPFKAGTVVQTNDTSGTVVMLDYVSGGNINSSAYGTFSGTASVSRYGRFVELGTARNVHIHDNIIAARNVGLHLAAATQDVTFIDNDWTTVPDREIYNLSSSPTTIVAGSDPLGRHRSEVFLTRADLVTAVARKMTRSDGVITIADGLAYKWQSGATVIPDLPGLVPAGEAQFEHWGAVGGASGNDAAAIQAAIDYMIETGTSVNGYGDYRITSRLTIDPEDTGLVFWDGSTTIRPGKFSIFGKLIVAHNDIGLDLVGGNIASKVYINHLIGPGYGTIGTPGGTDERIGVRLSKGLNDVEINSLMDFNFGVLFDGAFSSTVRLNYAIACNKCVYARVNPSDSTGNQANKLYMTYAGGIFSSEAYADKVARKARGSDRGVHIADMRGSELFLGAVQYCQQTSSSYAVQLDEDCERNIITVYLEGGEGDTNTQKHLVCEGHDNVFYFDNIRSTDEMRNAVEINGIGNEVRHIGSRIGAASLAAIVPDAQSGEIVIGQGNVSAGRYRIEEAVKASALAHNLANSLTFTASGSLTATTGITFDVEEAAGATGFTLSWTGTNAHTYTSGAVTISGETNNRVLKWIQYVLPVAEDPAVALYILNGADDSVVGTGMTARLTTTDGKPRKLTYFEKIPDAVTSIKFRIVVRNTLGSGGGEIDFSKVFATFNLFGGIDFSADVAPTASIMQGVYAPTQRIFNEANKLNTASTTSLGSNICATGGSPMVVITDNSGANNIQSFTGLKDRSPCTIVNGYTSEITVKDAAGAWASDFTIPVGGAISVVSIDSAVYKIDVNPNVAGQVTFRAASGGAVANTGNTTENTVATITIPAGAMGPNGYIAIETVWTTTNNANTKTMRVKFNSTSYTAFSHTTSVGAQVYTKIRNRNSLSSQIGAASASYYSAGGAAHITSSHNTATALDVTITAQCVTSGADTITLESYSLEVVYMP